MSDMGLTGQLKYARRDLGNLLFHFTRRRTPVPFLFPGQVPPPPPASAFEILRQILTEGLLRGNNGYIKGGHRCVCFTEAPISELGPLFALSRFYQNGPTPRYEPYGIAVKKEWLFANGGRPVIYQSDQEYDLLPPPMQWRHVRYEPPGLDFSWEREWRVQTDALKITPGEALVVVPTAQEAHHVNFAFSQLSQSTDMTGKNTIYSNITWNAVSLDLFGIG